MVQSGNNLILTLSTSACCINRVLSATDKVYSASCNDHPRVVSHPLKTRACLDTHHLPPEPHDLFQNFQNQSVQRILSNKTSTKKTVQILVQTGLETLVNRLTSFGSLGLMSKALAMIFFR